MNPNYTYCVDYFTIYLNIKLLCCLPEINIRLHVDYISIKKKKRKPNMKVIKDIDTLFPKISD